MSNSDDEVPSPSDFFYPGETNDPNVDRLNVLAAKVFSTKSEKKCDPTRP